MKGLIKLFIVLLVLQNPGLVYGSEWDKFLEIRDQYYYLDKQDFNNISCEIDVPLMTNIIKQLKAQLKPLKDKIEVTDDLSKFTVNYSPASGLSFTYPELDIKIISEEEFPDPEKTRNGLNMTKKGFKQQADGVIESLNGVFDDYFYPKKNQYENIKVSQVDGKVTVTYKKEGDEFKETYSANVIEGTQNSMGREITYKQTYEKNTTDKLLIKHMAATVTSAFTNMKIDTSVEYQNVEHLIFPKLIKTYFEQEIQSITSKGQIDININNCTIK